MTVPRLPSVIGFGTSASYAPPNTLSRFAYGSFEAGVALGTGLVGLETPPALSGDASRAGAGAGGTSSLGFDPGSGGGGMLGAGPGWYGSGKLMSTLLDVSFSAGLSVSAFPRALRMNVLEAHVSTHMLNHEMGTYFWVFVVYRRQRPGVQQELVERTSLHPVRVCGDRGLLRQDDLARLRR